MKIYDNIFCVDEGRDLPAWVAVELTEDDERNIDLAKKLFEKHPQMQSVVFDLQGSYDFEGDEPFYAPLLEIDRHGNKYLTLSHRYSSDINVELDYDLESTEYTWNGKEVVEV